jgi:hypothetical protein
MKVLYSVVNCPACMQRRRELVDQEVLFKYVVIGQDIPMTEFFAKYPDVKSVPFEVDEPEV